jgi:hypothetical protein
MFSIARGRYLNTVEASDTGRVHTFGLTNFKINGLFTRTMKFCGFMSRDVAQHHLEKILSLSHDNKRQNFIVRVNTP